MHPDFVIRTLNVSSNQMSVYRRQCLNINIVCSSGTLAEWFYPATLIAKLLRKEKLLGRPFNTIGVANTCLCLIEISSYVCFAMRQWQCQKNTIYGRTLTSNTELRMLILATKMCSVRSCVLNMIVWKSYSKEIMQYSESCISSALLWLVMTRLRRSQQKGRTHHGRHLTHQ